MTQHFSVFEVKMTLNGLASSYLALSVIVLLRYILIYCRILFIINRGTVRLYNFNKLIWNERKINLKLKWKKIIIYSLVSKELL